MVDLKSQYEKIKPEIDAAIQEVIDTTAFVKGPIINTFQQSLEQYLGVKHVIPVGNGTDALQISLMALGLKPGDEVIVPTFTFIASAEVIALLGLTPVLVDVEPDTFNASVDAIEKAILTEMREDEVFLAARYSFDMPVLYEYVRSGFDDFEDFVDAISFDSSED